MLYVHRTGDATVFCACSVSSVHQSISRCVVGPFVSVNADLYEAEAEAEEQLFFKEMWLSGF